jgi:acyl-CoA synthetase (AMP-forming)/AMP-acid ligase II
MRESASFRATFTESGPASFRTGMWKHGVPGPDERFTPMYPTIVAALEKAETKSKRIGITLLSHKKEVPPEHRSWAALANDARALAARLHARGVRENETVLLVFDTSFEFITSFFALQFLGAIPVPTYPPALFEKVELALGRLAHIGKAAGVETCLTNALFFPLLGELVRSVPTLRDIVAVDRLPSLDFPQPTFARVTPESICFLQYTSGSTDRPKGVVLTHDNVCSNLHVIGQGVRITRKDVAVSWLPLYHDMGLIGALMGSLFLHTPLVLMSPLAFLEKPGRWLRAISDYGATISTAPNFGYALCVKRTREQDRRGLDLSSWRLAMNGAEPVHHRTLVEFEREFAPHGFSGKAFLPVYGLAESALAVTFPDPGRDLRFAVVDRDQLANGHVVERRGSGTLAVVSVGKPMPGHRVYVADAQGQPVRDGEVGHIVLTGPSVMRGYYRDDEQTRSVLQRGFLWTGDLGFIKDGELYVTGRAKDLIVFRGRNYYAEDVERVVERIRGVRPGGVVAFSLPDEEKGTEATVLVCETTVQDDSVHAHLIDQIAGLVSEQVGLRLDEIVVVPPGTVPRTSSGKRQRGLTKQLYASGDLLKPNRTGALKAALIYARSRVGLWALQSRRRRRDPEGSEA